MWMRVGALGFFIVAAILPGCSPMQAPMVPRIDERQQKEIDESWEKALQPVDNLTRQQMLDVLVVTQAYQMGVDRLSFRSEKWVSGGLVVMDVTFDRLRPDLDTFVISVFDRQGKPLRQETYDRHDVEQTNADLLCGYPTPIAGEDAQLTRKRTEQDARMAFVKQFFPAQRAAGPAPHE